MRTLSASWRIMRPKQWTKNVLVLAAPLAAGDLFRLSVAAQTALAFLAFCCVSSAVYCFNDVADREVDRLHPTKNRRPVAAEEISVPAALALGSVLGVVGLALAWLGGWQLLALLASYVAMQVAYAWWLKNEPVFDIIVIAVGFIMRAVAGGLAAELPISQWFLLVTGFGSLFIVAGKRYSELHALGSGSGTRRSLTRYTATYLRFVWSMAAAGAVMSYALWAFEVTPQHGVPWREISIAPFLMGLLRYAVDIDAGTAAEPEDIVLADGTLQVLGLAWLVSVSLGVLGA
ncbi:MAG TPA: decaprenyl-phosphate phosphoribosyltransferase [Marmoricola sp.]|nr:decaprenyl-phosphate phosphoribosyltransferase [Marmoricola sp.]